MIAIGLALVSGGAIATANAFSGPSDEARNQRAEELAQKLGVDKEKVTSAMEEIRNERRNERQTEVSTKLDQAVKDGAITAEQKEKITDKMSEMGQQRGQKRTEMEQWYKDNGIDFDKVHQYIGFGNGNGKGGGHGRMMQNAN